MTVSGHAHTSPLVFCFFLESCGPGRWKHSGGVRATGLFTAAIVEINAALPPDRPHEWAVPSCANKPEESQFCCDQKPLARQNVATQWQSGRSPPRFIPVALTSLSLPQQA